MIRYSFIYNYTLYSYSIYRIGLCSCLFGMCTWEFPGPWFRIKFILIYYIYMLIAITKGEIRFDSFSKKLSVNIYMWY